MAMVAEINTIRFPSPQKGDKTAPWAVKRDGRGNPRLGRESKAEKLRRTKTWRNLNEVTKSFQLDLTPEEREYETELIPGVLDALALEIHGVDQYFDNFDRKSYWR